MNIRIEGLGAVTDMLERYADEARGKFEKGIARGCEIVKDEAKTLCPVDTGELRESITAKAEGLRGDVGTNKEYAAYVELGTYKMKAQPYLVPALETKKEDVINAVKEEFV